MLENIVIYVNDQPGCEMVALSSLESCDSRILCFSTKKYYDKCWSLVKVNYKWLDPVWGYIGRLTQD